MISLVALSHPNTAVVVAFVVIASGTGEAAAQSERADPEVSQAGIQEDSPRDEIAPPFHRVRLLGEGLVFRRVDPAAPLRYSTDGLRAAPTVLCERAPCDVVLRVGERIAVQPFGEERLVRIRERAWRDGSFQVRHHRRRGRRMSGGLLLGIGGLLGAAGIVAGGVGMAYDNTFDSHHPINPALLGMGVLVLLASVGIGSWLLTSPSSTTSCWTFDCPDGE